MRYYLCVSLTFIVVQHAMATDVRCTIVGTVVERRTHEPFAGIDVLLDGILAARTNAHGEFEINEVPVGDHGVTAKVPEWGTYSSRLHCEAGAPNVVRIMAWPSSKVNINGILAHYALDGNGADQGPNEWHGVNHGASPSEDRHGVTGGAMHFDGETQRIEVDHQERLNQLPLSIAFWVNVESGVADPSVWLGKYNRHAGDGWCVIYLYKQLAIVHRRLGYGSVTSSYASRQAEAKWHHVVVTMDTIGTVIHFDGAREPKVIGYERNPTPTQTTEPMFIGYLNSKERTTGLKGSIDDFYIFDHVLSDAEIETLQRN